MDSHRVCPRRAAAGSAPQWPRRLARAGRATWTRRPATCRIPAWLVIRRRESLPACRPLPGLVLSNW